MDLIYSSPCDSTVMGFSAPKMHSEEDGVRAAPRDPMVDVVLEAAVSCQRCALEGETRIFLSEVLARGKIGNRQQGRTRFGWVQKPVVPQETAIHSSGQGRSMVELHVVGVGGQW